MPEGNTPFAGGSGPTWNDAMMLGEARRFQANNPNYIPGPGEPDFFGRRPPPTPQELADMAAQARTSRALVWMFIFTPIGIIKLLRSQGKPAWPAARAMTWAILAFIFGCYTVIDLADGHPIDAPVSIAIATLAGWRAWRNVRFLRIPK